MRSLTTSRLGFGSVATVTGAAQRTEFLQGDNLGALVARFNALVNEFAALNVGGAGWVLVHFSLAGAGDGSRFVIETRWGDDNVANVSAAGMNLTAVTEAEVEPALTLSSGSESRALENNALKARRDTIVAGLTSEIIVNQTLLAGGSHGHRFLNAFLGEIDRA